jgi:hypothetical protein
MKDVENNVLYINNIMYKIIYRLKDAAFNS